MKTPRDTDRLIEAMASEGGGRRLGSRMNPTGILSAAVAISLLLAVAMALILVDSFAHVVAKLDNPWFYHKVVSMAAVAAGAFVVLRDLSRIPRQRTRYEALLPALLILIYGALRDSSKLALSGGSPVSIPTCVGTIVLFSMPALAMLFYALRIGAAATRPGVTGAVAGMLASALGAAGYALVCRNDGGLFVTVWYGTAIILMMLVGRLLGRPILAW